MHFFIWTHLQVNPSILNLWLIMINHSPWLLNRLTALLTTEQHNPDVITMHFMDDCFVNLWDEVILNLLWQSGASESGTVCFVISLSICYWLFKCCVLRIMCVRDRERVTQRSIVCVCVCVWERKGGRERARERPRVELGGIPVHTE